MASSRKTVAKQKVAAHLGAIDQQRPGKSFVADRVMKRAVEVYGNHHPLATELVSRRNALEKVLRSDIPDVTVRRGFKKSLSRDSSRSAAGLMLYEPRPVKNADRTLIGAYGYIVVLKPSEIWLLTSVEPAVTQSHLYERILERSSGFDLGITEVQEKLSDIWIALLWMRSRRVLAGRGFIPHEFMTPWNDGLLFGRVEKVEKLPDGAANPTVHVVTNKGTQRYTLPDFYAEGDKRVSAFTHTFVDATKLQPHQIALRDRLGASVAKHRRVLDHFKLTWMVAAGDDNPFTREIMDIFRFESPTTERIDAALSEMEEIVDCEEWQKEAAFSARSQVRHQTEAVAKAADSVNDSSA